jgi:transposase
MPQVDDPSRSLQAFEQNKTLVAVLQMSQSTWLAAGVVP